MFTLKLLAGAGIAVMLAFGGGYYKGYTACSDAAKVAQLQETVRYLNAEIARREARTQADNAARETDRAERDRLEALNKELLDELQDPDRVCLDEPDVDRVRRLWR